MAVSFSNQPNIILAAEGQNIGCLKKNTDKRNVQKRVSFDESVFDPKPSSSSNTKRKLGEKYNTSTIHKQGASFSEKIKAVMNIFKKAFDFLIGDPIKVTLAVQQMRNGYDFGAGIAKGTEILLDKCEKDPNFLEELVNVYVDHVQEHESKCLTNSVHPFFQSHSGLDDSDKVRLLENVINRSFMGDAELRKYVKGDLREQSIHLKNVFRNEDLFTSEELENEAVEFNRLIMQKVCETADENLENKKGNELMTIAYLYANGYEDDPVKLANKLIEFMPVNMSG